MIKENEFLRSKIDISSITNNCNESGKSKEIEDIIQKKNKEIYDLTVQLGCLKEENYQLKKD